MKPDKYGTRRELAFIVHRIDAIHDDLELTPGNSALIAALDKAGFELRQFIADIKVKDESIDGISSESYDASGGRCEVPDPYESGKL